MLRSRLPRFSHLVSQLESNSDPESLGVLARGGRLGEAREDKMGVLDQHACLRIADVSILFTGMEAKGVLVRRGRFSAADSGVPHSDASPELLLQRECVGVEDVPGTGDNGELTMSPPNPTGMLVRHMGGIAADVLGLGLPLRRHLRKEQRFCKVCGGDFCNSSS